MHVLGGWGDLVIPSFIEHTLRHVLTKEAGRIVSVGSKRCRLLRAHARVGVKVLAGFDSRRYACGWIILEKASLCLEQLAVGCDCADAASERAEHLRVALLFTPRSIHTCEFA